MKLLLNVKITKSIEMEIAHQISSSCFTVPYKSTSGKMPSAVLKPIYDLEVRWKKHAHRCLLTKTVTPQ